MKGRAVRWDQRELTAQQCVARAENMGKVYARNKHLFVAGFERRRVIQNFDINDKVSVFGDDYSFDWLSIEREIS